MSGYLATGRKAAAGQVLSALAEGMICDPGGEEVDNLAGSVSRWFRVPAAIEVRDHLAVGLAAQPEFADPAGAELARFASEIRQTGIIKVRNQKGYDQPRYSVLALRTPIVSPADNLQ